MSNGIINIPYGRGHLAFKVPAGRQVSLLAADEPESAGRPEAEIIKEALAHPINSHSLAELARGKSKVVVVTSDHTRPVPSRLTLPPMLEEIRRGSPEADITILIGVGSHRATTLEEMREKFGPEFTKREKIINHDPRAESGLVSLGRLPSGGELIISRLAAEADLLVADGFIEPHQFAGFSGGRKSILPGIASLTTVLASHNAEFTVHPQARPGSLEGNPFHADMIHAARTARLAFILNVALSSEKKVVAAFAGDMDAAHLRGCDFVLKRCGVKSVPSPVVITSNGGYPLDQNIYQATKSIMAADLTCAEGGVIIAACECADGHGAEAFYQSFRQSSPDQLLAEIAARSREETAPDQWVIQLTATILKRRKVIMVTGAPPEMIETFGMKHASTLEEALSMADQITGLPNGSIAILPDAVSLLIH